MKRVLLALVVVSLLVVGCQPDNNDGGNVDVQPDSALTISLEQATRTSLGASDDQGVYPTYWSIGDEVVVNGVLSDKVSADEHNKSVAKFDFPEGSIEAPYSATYPYCSFTKADKTYVEFPSEQSYVAGGVASNTLQMCGYAESGNEITLQHLSAILHFPVKAEGKIVNLEKVVVTSTSGKKLSGVFKVDCQSVTLSETANGKSALTYVLSKNFSLLTAEICDLYIVVPAGEIGECTIEFVETSGDKMTATWSPNEALPRGVVQEFKTIFYSKDTSCELELRDMSEVAFKRYAGADEIKIISFNVRTTLNESDPANSWDNRKEMCVALLKDHMPSLIGVQEAKYNAHWTYLKEQLAEEYSGFGVSRETGEESGTGETMGILYNKSVLQLQESGTFWLSETPDVPSKGWGANHKRSATWSIFKHRTSGKKFCYVNTHIDHESKEAQVEGMKLISRFLQKYRKDYMLFVSADFNMRSTNEAFDVVESYLHNTRDVAPAGLTDENTTYNGYTPSKHSIIDHIYCSNYLKVVEYHTINEQYGNVKYISDHYPIYSIIKLQ